MVTYLQSIEFFFKGRNKKDLELYGINLEEPKTPFPRITINYVLLAIVFTFLFVEGMSAISFIYEQKKTENRGYWRKHIHLLYFVENKG